MNTIAVTGVAGQVGSALAAELSAAGHDVVGLARGAGRDSAPAVGYRPRSVDLDDPSHVAAAVQGADALFLLSVSAHPVELVRSLADTDVRSIVLLSSQGAGTRPLDYAMTAAHESAARTFAHEWTILRPSGFASNAFGWAESVRERDAVFAPFGDIALPVIDPQDIVESAAVVLSDPHRHAGRVYELTGPAAVSPREQARAIADVVGHAIDFVELDPAAALHAMSQMMPQTVAEATLGILGHPSESERRPSADVSDLLGRPATSFADWAARNVAAFTRA
ncbi:NAD(P)H-binding protein [Rathayibacter sp. CAU 1779]